MLRSLEQKLRIDIWVSSENSDYYSRDLYRGSRSVLVGLVFWLIEKEPIASDDTSVPHWLLQICKIARLINYKSILFRCRVGSALALGR